MMHAVCALHCPRRDAQLKEKWLWMCLMQNIFLLTTHFLPAPTITKEFTKKYKSFSPEMIEIFFFILAAIIIAAGYLRSRAAVDKSVFTNPELEAFYDMPEEPVALRCRQLVKAAALNLTNMEFLSEQLDSMATFHADKLIGDEYCNRIKTLEEELVVERIAIESEAEMLKPGFRESIFSEASKLKVDKPVTRKKLFDEGLYMKRKEILASELKASLLRSK